MSCVKKFLKEKEICEQAMSAMSEFEFYTYSEVKFLMIFTLALSCFSYFVLGEFGTGHDYVLLVVVGITSIPVSLGLSLMLMFAFFSKRSKVIRNSSEYLENVLGKNDFDRLCQLFSEKEINGLSDHTKCLEKKIEGLNEKFLEKSVIKEFHEYLLKNEEVVEKYLPYFKDRLGNYNKVHNWKANEISKVNAELSAAGFVALPVKDESLVLKIEEND